MLRIDTKKLRSRKPFYLKIIAVKLKIKVYFTKIRIKKVLFIYITVLLSIDIKKYDLSSIMFLHINLNKRA